MCGRTCPVFKEFFLAVDGSQAAEPWSALPQALFAPIIRESPGVLPGKAIEDTPEIDPSLDWENNVYVYRGGLDWQGRENDKLHLKLRYFEYINAEGLKNYVVMWGSANTSHNASKLNADVTYIFKTKDAKLAKTMRPFFQSLREDTRMLPYRIAYLSRVFLEEFNPTKDLQSQKYMNRFAKFLSGGKRRDSFNSVLEVLREAGPATSKGKLILKWLEWNSKYRSLMKLAKESAKEQRTKGDSSRVEGTSPSHPLADFAGELSGAEDHDAAPLLAARHEGARQRARAWPQEREQEARKNAEETEEEARGDCCVFHG